MSWYKYHERLKKYVAKKRLAYETKVHNRRETLLEMWENWVEKYLHEVSARRKKNEGENFNQKRQIAWISRNKVLGKRWKPFCHYPSLYWMGSHRAMYYSTFLLLYLIILPCFCCIFITFMVFIFFIWCYGQNMKQNHHWSIISAGVEFW